MGDKSNMAERGSVALNQTDQGLISKKSVNVTAITYNISMDKDDPKHLQSMRLRRGRRRLHLSLNHARSPARRLFAKPRHLTADRNY